GGGYCVAAGLDDALDQLESLRFQPHQLDYLDGLRLFRRDFLDWLAGMRFTGDVRTVAEGSVVHPNVPLLEVVAPLAEAQWVETLLLNTVNFQTLVATKASRIVQTAKPATVVEFGLRRAQGPNGGLWASRAAYLAGCAGTSNVEAGLLFGVPVIGTHAHSWVMSFDDERAAFDAYAAVYPDDTTLLIDTYDTLQTGLPNALAVAKQLEAAGRKLRGVRLDSGDLAYLARACRDAFDAAGLPYVKIVASSDIDEYTVAALKQQDAPIDVYGVGTRLVTAFQEPALGGVYKLAALQGADGVWRPKIKISGATAKTTIPGRKQAWRWERDGRHLADALSAFDEPSPSVFKHPDHDYQQTAVTDGAMSPLLELRMTNGRRLAP
ncbi:MAG: nicotinate phosphoribosyltransferase, partial [Planctomycetia bacterium]